jgi:hypothetical protein
MTALVCHFGGQPRVQHTGEAPCHFATPLPAISLTMAGSLEPLAGSIQFRKLIPLTIQGTLPPLVGDLEFRHPILLTIQAELPALSGLATLHYDPAIWTPLTVAHVEAYRQAEELLLEVLVEWKAGSLAIASVMDRFRDGAALDAGGTLPLAPTQALDSWAEGRWREAGALDSVMQDGFQQMMPIDVWNGDRWRDGSLLAVIGDSAWRQAAALDLAQAFRIRPALALDLAILESAGDGRILDRYLQSGWREAALLVALSAPFPPELIPPPPGRERRLICHFGWIVRPILTCHWPPDHGHFIIIPVQEFYRVIPDVHLLRLPDRVEIPLQNFQVRVDIGLSLHGLTAGIIDRLSYERLCSTAAVQVELSAQGYLWRFLVNRLSGTRQFGEESYSLEAISLARALGRGRAVPRFYVETEAKTLEQLAAQELAFTEWTLDWSAATWPIPANTWSYDRLTPLEAIQALAEAAGAYVHAGRADQSLSVKPRYRILPWHLADEPPDVILPADPVQVLSFESDPQEDYTAVYVHGTTADRVSALVQIDGSGGLIVPDEPQTNPLLVDGNTGCRAFGARFLGDHQSATRWTLLLPLTPADGDVPLLDIGQIIQFNGDGVNWRGIVEGVQVGMTGVELTQQIEVVTYG